MLGLIGFWLFRNVLVNWHFIENIVQRCFMVLWLHELVFRCIFSIDIGVVLRGWWILIWRRARSWFFLVLPGVDGILEKLVEYRFFDNRLLLRWIGTIGNVFGMLFLFDLARLSQGCCWLEVCLRYHFCSFLLFAWAFIASWGNVLIIIRCLLDLWSFWHLWFCLLVLFWLSRSIHVLVQILNIFLLFRITWDAFVLIL